MPFRLLLDAKILEVIYAAYTRDLMMSDKAEKLRILIESAKNVRSELKLYGSERFEWATYEDVMINPVDCLIQALDEYEATNE